jgi:hypothetical protein
MEMLIAEQLRGLARWLSAEAERRKKHVRAPAGWWEFTGKWPGGRALTTDNREQIEPPFASASLYPRKNSVLLQLMPEARCDQIVGRNGACLTVIVTFGNARGGDVHGRGETEKDGKRRQFRQAFRSLASKGWTTEVMKIDHHTKARDILEQLAAFCLKRGIDPDGSLARLVGLTSRNETRQRVAAHLVQNFTDPRSPRSYPAYRRLVRQFIVGSEAAGSSVVWGDNAYRELADWRASPKETRKVTRPPKSSSAYEEFSVTRAERASGIPRRTIYHWIHVGKIRAELDSYGRLVLTGKEMQKLSIMHARKTASIKSVVPEARGRADLIARLANERGIQRDSARKRINRDLKRGQAPPELALRSSDSK